MVDGCSREIKDRSAGTARRQAQGEQARMQVALVALGKQDHSALQTCAGLCGWSRAPQRRCVKDSSGDWNLHDVSVAFNQILLGENIWVEPPTSKEDQHRVARNSKQGFH